MRELRSILYRAVAAAQAEFWRLNPRGRERLRRLGISPSPHGSIRETVPRDSLADAIKETEDADRT